MSAFFIAITALIVLNIYVIYLVLKYLSLTVAALQKNQALQDELLKRIKYVERSTTHRLKQPEPDHPIEP